MVYIMQKELQIQFFKSKWGVSEAIFAYFDLQNDSSFPLLLAQPLSPPLSVFITPSWIEGATK